MLSLLVLLQVSAGQVPAAAGDTARADTFPRVTLPEALRRSASLDPDYVRALGQIEDAEWGRRAARLAFFIPSVEVGLASIDRCFAVYDSGLWMCEWFFGNRTGGVARRGASRGVPNRGGVGWADGRRG